MARNNMACKRVDAGVTILVLFGLTAGLRANEIALLMPNQPPAATRILSFPPGQRIGNLNLEPKLGQTLEPKGVRLYAGWDYFGVALGEVRVPAD